MIKKLKSLLFLVLMLSTIGFSLPIKVNAAYTKNTVESLVKNQPHYIPGVDCLVSTAVNARAANGKVYMIGDSITEGTASELKLALDPTFNEIVIDGKSSRKLSEGDSDLDGIGVLSRSAAAFAGANTIVIALGTNGGVTNENIDKTMSIIKDTGATVYWVNIGVDNSKRTSPLDADTSNRILQENTAKGYTVIDWAAQVKQHPDYIDPDPGTGLGVHPIGEGKNGFANTVAGSAGGGNSVAERCCPNGTSGGSTSHTTREDLVLATPEELEENAATIYRYLVGKGFTNFQAAGALGNMHHESGFEPRKVQYGMTNSRGEVSRPGQPSSLDLTAPPGGSTGYGIVQYTPGTKIMPAAQEWGRKPFDLTFQLDFLWEQFQSNESAAYKAITESTTLEEATVAFEVKYERHAGPPQPDRITEAQKWLDKFGQLGGGVSPSAGCGSETNGDFNGYFQMDADWKNIPYAGGTVGSSGCGATSLATVISTLKGDKSITPATIVQDIANDGLQPTTVSLTPFTAIPKKYGLNMTNYTAGEFAKALEQVNNSNGDALMIANVRPGYWTSVGHYFVIRGTGPDGKIQVHDVGETTASHPKTDKTYDPEFFTGGETNPINFMVISK